MDTYHARAPAAVASAQAATVASARSRRPSTPPIQCVTDGDRRTPRHTLPADAPGWLAPWPVRAGRASLADFA
ncbi:hypothetical protein [Streptantibioticus rubrisoli]|uniref:Uncharacterized protein n=1 Tax=Streptantibioticus rubrisoli TaxID=1387313 RepID=A0ABT1P7S0_9ACTN|nr:hypothetical protein [Streptantibioticus rubrisoli]MCQ4041422.1 hypothetical protein [Streptantibioticus rubrisoli]